ncbi:MAG: hypothetical protein Q4A07_09305 [Coriobacteriales bacterium]|nr:hypothetical protein [Coriobacteriales bacterium]
MEVVLPNGGLFDYEVKVFKVQLIGKEELFKKRLLILLPYYLMRYEQRLAAIEKDDEQTAHLIAECIELRMQLAEATIDKGDALLYEELTELIIRVSDYLTHAYAALQKKVRAAMGGEVLELLNDKAERWKREAEKRGLKQGLEQGASELAELLKGLGVGEVVINDAMEMLREKREQAASVKEE